MLLMLLLMLLLLLLQASHGRDGGVKAQAEEQLKARQAHSILQRDDFLVSLFICLFSPPRSVDESVLMRLLAWQSKGSVAAWPNSAFVIYFLL